MISLKRLRTQFLRYTMSSKQGNFHLLLREFLNSKRCYSIFTLSIGTSTFSVVTTCS